MQLNAWKSLSDLTLVFQYEPTLQQELITVYNQQISSKAIDFLDQTTDDYNTPIFSILKICYVPAVIRGLAAGAPDEVARFQFVATKCWSLIKEAKTDLDAESLQEFTELIFGADLLEAYSS